MTPTMPTWPNEPVERAPRRGIGRVILAVLAIGALAFTALWWQRSRAANGPVNASGAGGAGRRTATVGGGASPSATSSGAALTDTSAQAPGGTRVVIRVVNATSVRGLARRATFLLRDFGYDVVDFDSSPKDALEATVIEVHTGHEAWAGRVRKALGVGEIRIRPDSLRYVDLTIRIGRDWQPPAEPLRP